MTRWALLLVLALVGCDRPSGPTPATVDAPTVSPAAQAAVEHQPAPVAVEAVAEAVSEPLAAAQDAVAEVLPATVAPETQVEPWMPLAASLIVRWEISSPAYYERRLSAPIWPKGASGVTWCIGYDGGHQRRAVIVDDWASHPHVDRLAETAGIRGEAAGRLVPGLKDIHTPYADCLVVFETRTLLEYDRMAARAFGPGYLLLKPEIRAALVSLVYNRGAAMAGDSRREMREIPACVASNSPGPCIARLLRSMKRLWIGTVNERGLSARREAEAVMAES